MASVNPTLHFQAVRERIDFSPGTVLGSYRILRRIGAGGMGAVYEVEHEMLHQRFALKTLFVQGETEADRQECIDRFLQEARITSQLRHPGIVSVQTLEYDKVTGALYFVMDYVSMTRRRRKALLHSAFSQDVTAWTTAAPVEAPADRSTLSLEELYQYGKRIGRQMNPELSRKLTMEIAQALDYAHHLGNGIIHRDIKPANILIQEDGHAVLADFGVAKIADSVLRKRVLRGQDRSLSFRMEAGGESYHMILGTAEYMAPELRTGESPSPQTDLYALGATLYQLLVGELPSGTLAPPSAHGLDPFWDTIIRHCLAANPQHRYPDVITLYHELLNFPKTVRRRKRKRFFLRAGGILVGGLLLAVSVVLLPTGPSKKFFPPEGIWFPRPTPNRIFQFTESADSVTLTSVHPETCGRPEIPAYINGKPVTQISPDAFQSCDFVSGVYLPVTLSPTAEVGLLPVSEAHACSEPECTNCKLRRSLLADVPPNTRPYLLSAASVIPQATVLRVGEAFELGAVVKHENVSYRLDEQGWVATEVARPVPKRILFPDMIGTANVYKIGPRLCEKQKALREVRFPRQLREIGENAFSGSGLTGKLEFPSTLLAIHQAAFAHNSAITGIVFPPNLEILATSAFQNTRALEAVTLPDTITQFGDRVFCGTMLDQSLFRIPKQVTRSDRRFYWHLGDKVRTFEIPSISHFPKNSVDTQGTGSQSLTFRLNAPEVTIDSQAIHVYLNKHPRVTLQFREGAKVTLHANFIYDTALPMSQFHGPTYQLTVRIGDTESVWNGTQFVGNAVFTYNGKLTGPKPEPKAVTPPKEEPRYTLSDTTFIALHDTTCTTFTVPSGIQRIASGAFRGTACETLTLPTTLTTLESGSFKGMEKLKTIILPPSIDWQHAQYDHLFENCSALETIVISSDIPAWQSGMFAACRSLKFVVLNDVTIHVPAFVGAPLSGSVNGATVVAFKKQQGNHPNERISYFNVKQIEADSQRYIKVDPEIIRAVNQLVMTYNSLDNRPPILEMLLAELNKLTRSGANGHLPAIDAVPEVFRPIEQVPDTLPPLDVEPDWEFRVSNGSAQIVRLRNVVTGEVLELPSQTPDGTPVTGVCQSALQTAKVRHLSVPKSIINYEPYAFAQMPNLISAVLPAGNMASAPGLFQHCPKLQAVKMELNGQEPPEICFLNCPHLKLLVFTGAPDAFRDAIVNLEPATRRGWGSTPRALVGIGNAEFLISFTDAGTCLVKSMNIIPILLQSPMGNFAATGLVSSREPTHDENTAAIPLYDRLYVLQKAVEKQASAAQSLTRESKDAADAKVASPLTIRTTDDEIHVLKCSQTSGTVQLPNGNETRKIIVEAEAFAGCQNLTLEVVDSNTVFRADAFRNARIREIIFMEQAPLFTMKSFNGLLGKFPECRILKDGNSTPALITVNALKFLRPNPDVTDLYLFDYGNSLSKRLAIPEYFTFKRHRCKLHLLPACFAKCPNIETITLNSPCWTSLNTFSEIPKLKKIVIPRKYAAEAGKLQRGLQKTSVKVTFK